MKITRNFKNVKRQVFRNETLLFFIIIILALFIGYRNPRFLSAENLFDILRSSSFIGICSVGFLIVLISGGIDISFTATAVVAQYSMGLLLVHYPNTNIFVIILVPIIIGTVLGSINAFFINLLQAPAIIITIATLNIYYGAIQFISNGRWLYDFPQWFREFPRTLVFRFVNVNNNEYGLSIFTLLWFLLVVVAIFVLNKTVMGRKIFAVGGNQDAARRAGVSLHEVRFFCYALLGAIAGLGSIVHAMTTQTVAPNALINQNFDVLAAVIIGGANIFGGSGTLVGTVLGVIFIAFLKNGLTLMQVPSYWHQVLIGFILLFSVAITALREKHNTRRGGGIDLV